MSQLESNINNFCKTLHLSLQEEIRVRKIVLAMPQVNWTDALGNSQLKSKLWLVEHLNKFTSSETNIVMIGGWIGLIQYLMDLASIKYKTNLNLDLDQDACLASRSFNEKTRDKFLISNSDAYDFDYREISHLLVINTSCEHLEEYDKWINVIPKGTPCILQSNNMVLEHLPEHVNCKDTLEDFIQSSGLSQITYADAIDIGDGWNRYMIIGTR